MKTANKFFVGLLVLVALGVVGVIGYAALVANRTISDLLLETKQLRQALANLSRESQIGYAKVLEQETRDGKLFTRVLFVETEPGKPLNRLLEREYEVEGDVIHFDALIVRFDKQLVMDGEERSLYIWRRIYGESTRPEAGQAIYHPGEAPRRYAALTAKLPIRDRELFWSEIWRLANEPEYLAQLGVRGIYGNVVYSQVRPGLIYIFKVDHDGGLTQEVVPDL